MKPLPGSVRLRPGSWRTCRALPQPSASSPARRREPDFARPVASAAGEGAERAMRPRNSGGRWSPVTESSPCSRRGDAGVEPVAIAVERIDGGGEPPRLALGLTGDVLDLLRSLAEIGRGHLVALPPELGLVGHHGDDDGGHRADAPRAEPPQRAAVEIVLLGQQTAQHAAGIVRSPGRQRDGRNSWPNVFGPPEACRITGQTLTGNPP